jgi:hypothetical protein
MHSIENVASAYMFESNRTAKTGVLHFCSMRHPFGGRHEDWSA